MAQNDQIQLFENKRIRTAWDAEKEEWYFSIVDVVAVLTDQPDARHASTYWAVLKKRLNELHYVRPLPEDDGVDVPEAFKKVDLSLTSFFDLSLNIEGNTLTLTGKDGEIWYRAERGCWSKIRRKVHCSPFYTEKDSMDTPVIGAWGVKNGALTIRVYEIEFLEEDTLTLTEEEDGIHVSFANTTIPSNPRDYVKKVI